MKIEPLGSRILVRLAAPPDTTKGGIVVPDRAKQRLPEAIVIAVGPGTRADSVCSICSRALDLTERKPRPVCVSPNDRVLISRYTGIDIRHDDVDCLIVTEDDILGVIR